MTSTAPNSEQQSFLRPLQGCRVLAWTQSLAGAYAARLLADAGADVVFAAAPTGNGCEPDGEDTVGAVLTAYASRGTRRLTIDLNTAEGPEELADLVSWAEIFLHDRAALGKSEFGWDVDSLRAANPDLIVAAVTAFGDRGPRSGDKADDLITVSASDLAYSTPGIPDAVTDLDAEPPLRSATPLGDFIGGLMAAIGVLFALIKRERTGRGDAVEVSQQEAIACMMSWDLAMYSYGGWIIGRRPTRILQSPNHYLPIADGWAVLVAFLEPHWRALVDLMGNPDWAGDPRFATGHLRGEHWADLEPLLLGWLLEQPRDGFLERLQSVGIPSAPALSIAEAIENDHQTARRFLVPAESPDAAGRFPGDIVVVNGQRRSVRPAAGQTRSRDLLREWADTGRSHPRRSRPFSQPGGSRPLSGLRVIDLGQIVAVPLAGQWLAWLGAEVIYVETRLRPASRSFAPFAPEPNPDGSGIFNHINHNKASCTLNLGTTEGRALAKQLVATGDIVTENFSPGTLEKLGLGYQELRAVKPDVILTSLSAAGATGPWRNVSALHSGIILLSGLAAITGYPEGHPRIVGAILPDPASAAFCVLATLQAVYHRLRTGEGQHVQIAMTEVLQSLMPEAIFEYTSSGREPERIGNRHPRKAPHGIYRAAGDDRWIAISVSNDAAWQALCGVLNRPDLAADPRFGTSAGRLASADEIDRAIGDWSRRQDAAEAAVTLQRAGVAATRVADARDVLTDPHLLERGFIIEDDHLVAGRRPMPGSPWTFADVPPIDYRAAPVIGSGNDYVFGELLGLAPAEIRRLEATQVIY